MRLLSTALVALCLLASAAPPALAARPALAAPPPASAPPSRLFDAPPEAADMARLLRYPDIHGDRIAFVYGGDVWTVESAGGTARRLTSDEGLELFPKFSPDGRWIAYSAEYGGTRQVYVIGADGGAPRQLTFRNDVGPLPPRGGYDNEVLGWTPDGKNVVFRANRVPYSERLGRPYLVPAEGGTETPLQIPESGVGVYSPDGGRFAYTPISSEFRGWKRYHGGRAQDVWIYDLKANTSEQITNYDGADNQPVWLGDTIYFTSDRERTLNVYAYDTRTKQTRKVTNHTDYDVLWPSGTGTSLVYECGGYVYRLDAASGKSERVPIRVYGDFPAQMPYFRNVAGSIDWSHVSPSGARALFGARGEIFTAPAKEGEVRNISNSPGVRELDPVWSPDGASIAYLSDRSGEYEIYVRPGDGSGVERRVTTDGDIWRFPLKWSPDSRMLMYGDKRQRLRYVMVDTGRTVDVDTSTHNDITTYTWSPDSRWVAYTKVGDNRFSSIYVYSLADAKSYRLTSGLTSDTSPVFDPKGRYLYFLSNRDFNLTFSGFEFNYIYTNPTRVYVGILAADGPALFLPTSDEEKAGRAAAPPQTPAPDAPPPPAKGMGRPTVAPGAAAPGSAPPPPAAAPGAAPQGAPGATAPGAAQAAAPTADTPGQGSAGGPPAPRVRIDAATFENRVRAVPGPPNNYGNLQAVPEGVMYVSGPGRLALYNVEAKREDAIVDGVRDYDVTADFKRVLFNNGTGFGIVPIAPGQRPTDGLLKLDGMTVKVDPRAEWRQEYVDAWRILRDWFYDPKMHGLDWAAMRRKYEVLVPYVANRADLDFILTELGSELSAGHVYVEPAPDESPVKRVEGGLLGAELSPDPSGYFRVDRIFPGENWHEDFRSPLTEPGVNVHVGDFVVAVDGRPTREVKNFYELLDGKANRVVTLLVSSRPDAAGAHEERVRPVDSEQNLRYVEWVRSRREYVERASGGRIGYIHLPDTAVAGNRELTKYFFPQTNKEALIVDDRYNGGGFIPDRMIELLDRPLLHYWTERGLEPTRVPTYTQVGPKAMLVNGYAGSGGDALPYYFRKRGLGPIIGTRTWGGLIGLSGNPVLVDGGSIDVPRFRLLDTEGKWDVEGVGVAPDIEVVDRPELVAAGKDPSLERAVEVLLEALKREPPRRVVAPPPPDLSH